MATARGALPALLALALCSELGAAFQLTSKAFDDGEPIPLEYLKDDDNISPPLEFQDPPAGESGGSQPAQLVNRYGCAE